MPDALSHTLDNGIPTLALRNLGPMRESIPTAYATSSTSAPVASHTALSAFTLEMRWARRALAAWNKVHVHHTYL